MNDSDVKSPPTKRLKQAGIVAFVQKGKIFLALDCTLVFSKRSVRLYY